MLNLMKTLTAVRGISGYEKAVSDKLLMTAAPLCDRVYNDAMGSLIAYRQGSAPENERRRIMLCAHMDEIGFLVTMIDDNGFIRVAPVGGINTVAAAYTNVVFGNGVKGILVPESGTAASDLKVEKLYVDIGAKDRREAERKVKIGDFCALEGSLTRLCGRRIAGRPLDDRIGCAVLCKIAEQLKGKDVPDDIYFVFSVQEEVGLRGAGAAAYGIRPDAAIVYDVTLTGDVIGAKPMACAVGGGAAIKLKDRSLICDRPFADELAQVAKDSGIRTQFEILLAGGTDTAAIQISGAGVKVAALSVPCRYVHTGVEMIDLTDAEACADLTVAWLTRAAETTSEEQ